MPDYAEVAGCSSFRNPGSPNYESFGAYATTTLVGRNFPNKFEQKNIYSAPNSVHYNNFLNNSNNSSNQHQHQSNGSTTALTNNQLKMNIIENKMDHLMNNLNSPSHGSPANQTSVSVPHTPMFGTIKRNRFNGSNNSNVNKLAYSDKINFGDNGRSLEQPLFIKSNGTWTSIPSTTSNNSGQHASSSYLHANHHPTTQSTQSSLNLLDNSQTNSQNYLTSFGKSDKV